MKAADRIWPLFKTSLFAAVFIAFFMVYLPGSGPYAGGLPIMPAPAHCGGWGIIPLLSGGYVALRCVFSFAWTGQGTPAPFDPPRKLVVTGFYRFVRNRCTLGAALFVIRVPHSSVRSLPDWSI